ncbi:hypothetical protein GGX14DRAFT_441331 [Mycena pura]|uniref:Uncharacterized protein n=1 Tax=Mycena pura TaxID=153505 RepID=A0AAD6VUD6_9AGAR|nr:hypothetical protein GGX14DRAFT_441331 [Mycena pura]
MEYPESPEPVYRYNYDGVASPEQVPAHPYTYASPVAVAYNATPPRHRNVRSETTVSNTPMTYLSPFAQDADSASTPATESDPFEYDEGRLAPYSGKVAVAYRYQYGQPVSQPMYMGDGPRSGGSFARADRSSAALLQMTQRAEVDWTPAEFTPSMFSPEPPASAKSSSTGRNTLKKKRRPPPKGAAASGMAASVETFASSWLHGDMDSDPYTDDERPNLSGLVPVPVRVKSVGRVKAPRKETPAPVNARHGMARGSVYIQPITVPRSEWNSEVQIVQGGSSADSYRSEFDQRP